VTNLRLIRYSSLIVFTTLALLSAAPSYASSYYFDPTQTVCWDASYGGGGFVPCFDGIAQQQPYDGTQLGGTSSTICRANMGDPSSYCYIQAWQCDPDGSNCQPVKCPRGITSAGWCVCDPKTNVLSGSCMTR